MNAPVPMLTLAEAQEMLPSARLVGDGTTAFARVHTDTRTLQAGDLFVALRGETFDGNQFLLQACAAGASAAIAERGLSADLPGLLVKDSLVALQELSAAWRARFTLPLAAVVGSNGKTTVTQMTGSILRAWLGDAALATHGNLNNHIGVPLVLLRLREKHRAAVLELGMNHPGEIALLAHLAMPTVALITNAQREHQEFLDGVEAVARENGSVIDVLPATGTVVLPADDAFTPLWRDMAAASGPRRVMSFAVEASADVSAGGQWLADRAAWQVSLATPAGFTECVLRQAGRHNLRNAAAAAAGALALGAPLDAVARGLEAFEPVAGRSRALVLQRGGRAVTLIDDSYNANPDSVRAAIDLLAALPGPRWLVLGDMGEVGRNGPAFHAEVGDYARERGIESFWTAGTLARGCGAPRHFADAPAVIAALAEAPDATSILVKGSRFMKMERVVQALQAAAASAASASGTAGPSSGKTA